MLPLLVWLLCGLLSARAAVPTLPSSNVTFNQVEGNYLGFYWTQGNGAKRIVIARAGQPVTAKPQNGTTYTANKIFGQGDVIGSGEFVVGYGNIAQLTITGLTSGVDYYFAVFEFNGDGTTTEYLTTSFMTANRPTVQTPTTQVSGLSATNVTGNKATINWVNGNGYGRMIVMREGAAVHTEPTDFEYYNANSQFGSGNQIGTGNFVTYNWYSGTSSNSVTRLKNGTTYHVAAYEYNGWSGPAYNKPASTFSFTTPTEPTKAPGAMYFDYRDTKQFRALFPAGDGSKRILIGRKGSPVTTVPQDGVAYTPNPVFGQGSRLGTDEFVLYAGTDWLGFITGLDPATTYHFRAFEYEDATTIDYLTSTFSEGSFSTLGSPTTGPSNFTFSDVRSTQLTLKWDNGDGNTRILIGKANSTVDVTPTDFTSYTGNPNFSRGDEIGNGNFVLMVSNQAQATITQLQPGITYHFALFESNGSANPIYLKPGVTISVPTATKPTTHPRDVAVGSATLTTLRVTSNMGNGTHLLVIGREGAPVTAVPVDKQIYSPSWTFGGGTAIEPGQFVIHSDTWNAPTVNTLKSNTTYHFRVFNYNMINGEPYYYTDDPIPEASGTTIDYARPQASDFSASDIGHTSMKISFTAGGGTRRFVTYKAGAPVDAHPSDGVGYGAGGSVGNGNIVVGYTNTNEITATNLIAGTTYHFAIYEMTPSLNYYTPVPLTGQATTTGATQTITFPDFTAKTYGDADFEPLAEASSTLPVTYEFNPTTYAELVNGKIHILRSGTVSVTAKQLGDATYAPAPPVTKSLVIAKAPLNIRANSFTIPNGADIPALTATFEGLVLGETSAALTTQPTISTTATKNSPPGDYTISISGAASNNYAITHFPGILTIQPPPRTPQTITFPVIADLRYGMTHTALHARASSNLTVLYQSSNTNVAQIVNNEIQIKAAGTAKITAYCPGDQTWEDAPPVEHTITINKADLSIIAEDKIMTQGDAVPALTAQYIGFVYGEQASVLTTPARLATTARQNSAPGSYPITVTGATSGNYTITMMPGNVLVQPRPKQSQTITFPAPGNKTYGDANFAAGATASSNLTVTYRTTTPNVVSVVNGQIRIISAGVATVFANQAGDNDYEAALETSRTFTIQRAPLEVKADDKQKVEGQNNPTLTVTYTGFVKGETAGVLTQRATPTTAVTTSTPAGVYDIFPGSAAAANYTMTYVNGRLTVTARPRQAQNISFAQPAELTYGAADATLTATASSNLTVRFTSLTPDVATIVNGKIHIIKSGTATIRAEQDGNVDYLPATAVSRGVIIRKATLNAKPDNKTKVYGQVNPTFTIGYTGFVNGDDVSDIQTPPTVNTLATTTSAAGNYELWLTGGLATNYQFAFSEGALDITPAPQTINFTAPADVQYGDADFALTATATSGLAVRFVNETPDLISITGTQVRILKAGRASIRAEQAGDNNWQAAAAVTQVFNIEKAPLTVTADNKTRVEGTDNPLFTVSYNGFLNGDDAADINTPPNVTTTAVRNSQPGTYDIVAAGAVADNYRFTYVKGTLTVTPAHQAQPQTITFAAPAARTYGAADFTPTASTTSNLQVSFASSNLNVATIVNGKIHIVGAGNTTITATQAGNNDWLAAAPVSRTFTVSKAQLTVTADNKSKVTGTANPTLTGTFSGFVRNEGPAVLTTPVVYQTTATVNSPAGRYPITPSGGTSQNYNIRLVNGILTVTHKPDDQVKAWCSSRSTLQVRVIVTEAQGANITLYSTAGQQVMPVFKRLDAGSNTLQLDVSRVPSGVYILHVRGDKTNLTQNVAIN